MRIVVREDVPLEVADAVLGLLERWKWMVPTWVHELRILFAPSDDDSSVFAAVCANPEYRDAALTIYGLFLNLRPADRERGIVHELCHLLTAPLVEFYDGLITDEKLKEQHRLHVEGVTCDMQHAFTDARKRRHA